jgi:hypothetical protein
MKKTIQFFVDHIQQGQYLTLPFSMPQDIEIFTLKYSYERYSSQASQMNGVRFTSRREANIIDLGLIAPNGRQVGVSGSDKNEIMVSETQATPGYQPWPLTPGEWRILLGAYKVATEGVTILYELSFVLKHLRLFKGDLHTHTLASDGVLTAEELAQLARRQGLDFLAITDHNQMVSTEALPRIPGITLIPGVEWTHFQGHANFLGIDRPYDEPFFTNHLDGVKARFASARERGALISINHPFEESCPFQFDMNSLTFDCLEVWNGPMRVSNLQALGLWQQLLVSGRKIPICGGSDYHREHIFIPLGGPTMWIYAISASPADLLTGLKNGHAYITYAPNGPSLEMSVGESNLPLPAILGDSVPFSQFQEIIIRIGGLWEGDEVHLVTETERITIQQAEASGDFETIYHKNKPGFARIEILRSFLPGLPMLPALISNPIFFD